MHLQPITSEARKERAWNSPEAVRRRQLAEVNDKAAAQALSALTDAELREHVQVLDAEHTIKRSALHTVAESLARALNEKWRRGRG